MSAPAPHVLVVGDVVDDLIVRPSAPPRPDTDTDSTIDRRAGGSAANTACWLAAAGIRVTFAGTVHHDDVERHTALFERAGVQPRLAASDDPTGTIVLLVDDRNRTMLTSRGANRATGADLVPDALLGAVTHLHLTGYSLLEPGRREGWARLLAACARAGVTRSVDPGSAGYLRDRGTDPFRALVRGVEVLLPSLAEARELVGPARTAAPEAVAVALARDHAVVALKCGADGALAADATGALARTAARATRVVDPTGAGDAFDAGFLAAHLRGASLTECLIGGAHLGAAAVARLGARPA